MFVEYEAYEVETPEADETAEAEDDDSESEADPFEDTETNNSIVVDDMLNKVTAAATDDYAEQADEPIDPASRTVALTLPVVREGEEVLGAVLTYDMDENGAPLKTVAPGEKLRLVVNPGEGKLLMQGSLKVHYKSGDVTETRVVTADDHGRYLIDIPEDVDVSAGVQVFAEFVDDTQTDVAEPQRGSQIAGSVAITITENNNQAIIDAATEKVTADGKTTEEVTGAQVFAGRDVNVAADSTADIRNVADGTAVTQNVVTGTEAVDSDAEEEQLVPETGIIPIGAVKVEKLVLTPDRSLADPGDLVKVTVGYNSKQHIKAGTLKAVLTSADGTYREEIYMQRRSDFTYTFRMPDALPADLNTADLSVTFEGEVEEGATGAGVTTSLGGAVAITVSSSHNRADIKGAVDAARDVKVTADGEGAARTETRAGYSEGSTGIGGAISLQVAAMDSRARMHKTAAVQLDGELALEAENDVEFYVDADGSGSKRRAKSMGIGAGLALGFDSAGAVAAIEDNAALTGRTDASIAGLILRANQRVDDQVSAAAGPSSTGTSLLAALAMDFVSTSAKARLGDIRGNELNVRGDVTISADNAARHNIITEGAVAGQGTGVGAAIGLSIVKDKANATLAENLNAGGRVRINAVNESALRNVNIASASGGRIPFRLKIGDDWLWKLINGAVWLASVDDTLDHNVANIWLKYHPPGLLTNSSMGIAGAAGANIQTSVAKAEIPDNIAVTTAGKLAVTARNRTEAVVKGDSSTTNSIMGIGIGLGLNIVNMDNIAFIGKSKRDDFKKYDDTDKFERIPVYAVMAEEYEEWVPKWEDVTTDVDVYDLANNHLSAGSLNIYTGVEGDAETAAQARSDGAKTVGFITAGSLNAWSQSTDSFSVLFEGMTADIDGKANLEVKTQTRSDAVGYAPGKLGLADVDTASDARASVGTGNDQQTVGVVIGEGATLNAGTINISAENNGVAKADLIKGNTFTVLKIGKSSVPTNSWYNSVISVGKDATLNGRNSVSINSTSNAKANSVVEAKEYGLLLNYNKMMGKNYVKQINDVDFGDGSKVYSNGSIDINAITNTQAEAETNLKGGGLLSGNTAKAQNDVERTARVNIGKDVEMRFTDSETAKGALNINAKVGAGADQISASAKVSGKGFADVSTARAYNNVDQWAEIIIAEGSNFDMKGDINMLAQSTSYQPLPQQYFKGYNSYGIVASAEVKSSAAVPLPNGVARNTVNANAYVDINQAPAIGTSYAEAAKQVDPDDWAYDRLGISWTEKDGNGKLTIWAESGGRKTTNVNTDRVRIISNAYAKLNGIGKAVSEANITGTMINQIRTNDEASVGLYGTTQTHLTNDPWTAIIQSVTAESKVKKILDIKLGKTKEKEKLKWYIWNRCDFCHEGKEHDLTHSEQDTIEHRYKEAFDRAMLPIDTVANEVAGLRKTLAALQNINRTAVPMINITRARFGVEDNTTVGERFALKLKTLLERDVRFTPEKVSSYQLWTNTATRLYTDLLDYATRLYATPRGSGMGLQYLAEVFQYDLLNDGYEVEFDIVTALTENAYRHPVMPMGDIGSLDFSTGTLMLPAQSEHELYLHEVSAKWMMDKLNEGFLQTMIADTNAANNFALTGRGLPKGSVTGGAVYDGEQQGWKLYWLGETPDTVQDPDQTLIFLLINEKTDEVDAFRTSLNMLDRGDQPIDVSVYFFRDARADMREEEQYDLLFFDTPEGKQSIVKLMTDLMDGSELVMPKPLRIVLRAFHVNGATLSAYSLNDHFYVLLDGSKGGASLANLYRNTFDGDTFESEYMLIEGIASGDISVTLKKDQPIWPECTGRNDAEDLNGEKYTRVGGVWYPAGEAPVPTAMPDGMRAA